MPVTLFRNLSEKDKSSAVEKLIEGSTASQDFFMMVVLAMLTATLGLLLDSVAVIIGSMLIAPVLYPLLSLSMGITMNDMKLISRSTKTLLVSVGLGIGASVVATLLFSSQYEGFSEQLLAISQPTLIYAGIAMIAGLAASFAYAKPHLNETLPGVAVAVALIPPLAAVGIGLAHLDIQLVTGATLLFLINVIGIVFVGMFTFSLMDFYVKRNVADKKISTEDRKLKEEIKKASSE